MKVVVRRRSFLAGRSRPAEGASVELSFAEVAPSVDTTDSDGEALVRCTPKCGRAFLSVRFPRHQHVRMEITQSELRSGRVEVVVPRWNLWACAYAVQESVGRLVEKSTGLPVGGTAFVRGPLRWMARVHPAKRWIVTAFLSALLIVLVESGRVGIGPLLPFYSRARYLLPWNQAPVLQTELLLTFDEDSNQDVGFIADAGPTKHVVMGMHVTSTERQQYKLTRFAGGNRTGFALRLAPGDFLELPPSGSWQFGAEAFAIDAWIKRSEGKAVYILNLHPYDRVQADQAARRHAESEFVNHILQLWCNNSGAVQFEYHRENKPSVRCRTEENLIESGKWHHVAVTRTKGDRFDSIRVYVDGWCEARDDVPTQWAIPTIDGTLVIGANRWDGWFKWFEELGDAQLEKRDLRTSGSVNWSDGYLDELRVVVGTGRWKRDYFVPPFGHSRAQ